MDRPSHSKYSLKYLPRIDHAVYPVILICVIAAVLLLVVRHGLEWDGDPELYIMNARNIVSGLPYAVTGYLPNRANAINPASYPPGFPLFLAPIYAHFGIDIIKMKIECVIAIVLFLAVYFRIARVYLTSAFALATTAAIGLHPAFVDMADSFLLSEFPFLLFAYSALYLFHRLQTQTSDTRAELAATIIAGGVALACAFLTRSIGVLLFPAVFVTSLYYSKRLLTKTNLALALAGALILAVQVNFPGDNGTYARYFADFSLHTVLAGARRYASVSVTLLGKSAATVPAVGILAGTVFLGLLMAGFVDRVRRFTVLEVYTIIYVSFLLVFPITQEPARYAMPIWPLLFLYCANGVVVARRALSARSQQVLTAAVCLTVVVLYCAQYARMDFGPVPYSVDADQSRELFAAIRADLPEDARILTRKPTIIALYTGHAATIWPATFTDEELQSFLRRLKVDYVVQDIPQIGGAKPDDPLDAFIRRNKSGLNLVFKNGWFNVYRLGSAGQVVAISSAP
jgi:hypothetical protein